MDLQIIITNFTKAKKLKLAVTFNLVIIKIHNEHYCTVKGYGRERHMNMAFIEPRK